VIRIPFSGHGWGVSSSTAANDSVGASDKADASRLRMMLEEHFEFIWRSLRRLGLPEHVADDATQRVFVVASRRLRSIQSGSERAFLFRTAVRVACSERRSIARRREVLSGEPVEPDESAPMPDELLDQRRARELLEQVLAALDLDLRVVLVLFEFEGLTIAEIARTLDLPHGTAASRLRRAREEFSAVLERLQARRQRGAP
jgi:RNA polymerase sigma-70 factor (ECF subfamily)